MMATDLTTMRLDQGLVNELARPLTGILMDFFNDPENAAAFEKWLEERKGREVAG